MKNTSILILIIAVILTILLIIFPSLNSNYLKGGKLYISEIMASNNSVIKDNEGDYSDYIEIYNGYNEKINLGGYHLSDAEYKTDKWTFPNITINPHEYLIVYASGKDECDISKRVCHTNFKLSSKGEVITFSDRVGNILSKFTFPEQFSDISYGYKNGKYVYFSKPTPGEKNDSEEYIVTTSKNYKLEITEYMTHNKRSNYDMYGNYFDWIEVYNPTDKNYKLDNLYITDNPTKLMKYKIPNTSLKAKEYLIIYLTGKKINYDEGIYAPFSLSEKDEYIILSNGEDIIDKVKIVELYDDISYGKIDGEWRYFTTSTPGRANTTASFTNIGGLNGSS